MRRKPRPTKMINGKLHLLCKHGNHYALPEDFHPKSADCKLHQRAKMKERYQGISAEEKAAEYAAEKARRERRKSDPEYRAQEMARAMARSKRFRRRADGTWEKKCGGKCGEWKTLDEFAQDYRYAVGYSSRCIKCTNQYNSERAQNLSPKQKEQMRRQKSRYHKKRWENDPAYKKRILDYNRARRAAMTPEERRLERWQRHVRGKFRIDTERFGKLYEDAGGKCEICGKPLRPTHRRDLRQDGACPCIDHCEGCAIRGLLCRECNAGIGQFRHSIRLLLDAREYLQRARRTGHS